MLCMRWRLALPEPKLAKVAVTGGGVTRLLDLKYAVPGGIRGVKAPLSKRNAEHVMNTVATTLHALGVPGTLLAFDENEQTLATSNRAHIPLDVGAATHAAITESHSGVAGMSRRECSRRVRSPRTPFFSKP